MANDTDVEKPLTADPKAPPKGLNNPGGASLDKASRVRGSLPDFSRGLDGIRKVVRSDELEVRGIAESDFNLGARPKTNKPGGRENFSGKPSSNNKATVPVRRDNDQISNQSPGASNVLRQRGNDLRRPEEGGSALGSKGSLGNGLREPGQLTASAASGGGGETDAPGYLAPEAQGLPSKAKPRQAGRTSNKASQLAAQASRVAARYLWTALMAVLPEILTVLGIFFAVVIIFTAVLVASCRLPGALKPVVEALSPAEIGFDYCKSFSVSPINAGSTPTQNPGTGN